MCGVHTSPSTTRIVSICITTMPSTSRRQKTLVGRGGANSVSSLLGTHCMRVDRRAYLLTHRYDRRFHCCSRTRHRTPTTLNVVTSSISSAHQHTQTATTARGARDMQRVRGGEGEGRCMTTRGGEAGSQCPSILHANSGCPTKSGWWALVLAGRSGAELVHACHPRLLHSCAPFPMVQ